MEVQIVREVSADVVKRGTTRAIYAKQNDLNSRYLNVRIQEDGKTMSIDPSVKVILNVERSDKAENMFYGTVNEDGSVKVPLTSWMLELAGTLVCDISLISEDATVAKLTTMQFNIYVEAAVCVDEVFIETEEYDLIIDLLNRTSEAEAQASKAAADALYLKEQCEKATDAANTAAENANKISEELEDKITVPRERRQISSGSEAIVSISSEYLPDNGKEYLYYNGMVDKFSFTNLTETDGKISEDYWCLIIFNKAPTVSGVDEVITDERIKLLNPDLDLSEYTVVHLLLTYDGFNICCIAAGY